MAGNITQFQAPNLDLRPTETGIDAVQQGARRIGAFYGQAAEDLSQTGQRIGSAVRDAGEVALQHVTQAETINGAKNFAAMFANKTQEWNDIASKTPPDRMGIAAQQFREQIEPDLDKFQDSFSTEGGQKFAEAHVASLRQHLFEKTAADASFAAGEAAKVGVAQTVNQLASGARLDPSSTDFALQTAESTFEHFISASGLTGELASRLRTEGLQQAKVGIVKSAALGMIEKNPDVDLAAFNDKYSGLISGAEMSQLEKAQKAQIKANLLNDKAIEDYKVHQADRKAKLDSGKNTLNNVEIDPSTNRVTIKPGFIPGALAVLKNNPDSPEAREIYRADTAWGEHQLNQKQNPVDDAGVKQDFIDRMFSADNPTKDTQIKLAEVKGQLRRETAQPMLDLVKMLEESPLKGPIWHDTSEAVKAELMVTGINLPGKDSVGVSNYAKWAQTFIPQYIAMNRAGTLPPNALDIKNPDSFISKSMDPYRRTVQQKMNDYSDLFKNMSADTPLAPKSTPTVTALPPPDQRVKNQVYPTARGQMKWTGVDWVKP